ncbi:hypothetical protein ACOZ4L_02700 [Haloplanus ruber]|uniref:Uncharacterized protein n=1 Tax=Haloplanus ruber TaxID=869892 RepID=A0ABD6CZP2_9EURY|nr:hypothetical protein [Haloplanus ruber]
MALPGGDPVSDRLPEGATAESYWRYAWERIPFLNTGSWSVDWDQAALAGLGAVFTAFFDGIAKTVGGVFETFVITPVGTYAQQVTRLVESFTGAWALVLNFEGAQQFAQNFGLLGSVAITAIGAYLIVKTVEGTL